MLADTLETEFDVVDFLSSLCERMAQLFGRRRGGSDDWRHPTDTCR